MKAKKKQTRTRRTKAEMAVANLRKELLDSFRTVVNSWKGSHRVKAKRLGIKQPRLTLMLKHDGNYTVDSLIALNVKIGVSAPRLPFSHAATVRYLCLEKR